MLQYKHVVLLLGSQCWKNYAWEKGANREHLSALKMDSYHQGHYGGIDAIVFWRGCLLVQLPASVFSIWHEFTHHRTPLRTNWTKNSGRISLILLPLTQLRLQSGMSMPVFIFFRCLLVMWFKQRKHKCSNFWSLQPFLTWCHWYKLVSGNLVYWESTLHTAHENLHRHPTYSTHFF